MRQGAFQIEEYSLTLLKHKSYFNNRPLARCLDKTDEDEGKTKVQPVEGQKESTKDTDNEPSGRGNSADGLTKPIQTRTAAQDGSAASSAIQQLDGLMSEILTLNRTPREHGSGARGLEEIKVFWQTVRSCLWIDDDEIYEAKRRPLSQKSTGDTSQAAQVDSDIPELSTSASGSSISCPSESDLELPPPPMPDRPPPPIPATPRAEDSPTTSSLRTQHSATPSLEPCPDSSLDDLSWGKSKPDVPPNPQQSELPSRQPIVYHPSTESLRPETPGLPSIPDPPASTTSHSRYPSSTSSGRWTRPPTWRSPASLSELSSPTLPVSPVSEAPLTSPLPMLLPTPPPPGSNLQYRRHRSSHSRNRHPPVSLPSSHSSHPSTSTSSTSRSLSFGATDCSGSYASINTAGGERNDNASRTPKGSTSSIATTTRTFSSGVVPHDVQDVQEVSQWFALQPSLLPQMRPTPQRRMTPVEKLSEIDAFLSSSPDCDNEVVRKGGEGWI
ncbi:hypothetical protein VTJ49DRAFT_5371 [Mycothermus thermophilus]|uniref:Uncharacterized protein n=1 Tax=Humicola insolens TaxID=85995 RepID=A0ABR3V3E4_HUMIN